MSINYGGVDGVLSGELAELTDPSNKFITPSNVNKKGDSMSNKNNDSSQIPAFDPFKDGASTVVGVNTSNSEYDNAQDQTVQDYEKDEDDDEYMKGQSHEQYEYHPSSPIEEDEEEYVRESELHQAKNTTVSSSTSQYHELNTLSSSIKNDKNSTLHENYDDATKIIHAVHFALLYLMSNPDDTLISNNNHGNNDKINNLASHIENENKVATKSFDDKETYIRSFFPKQSSSIPLPELVFAEDAEVVLPQAHTASQLFGTEQRDGMELASAVGVDAICDLMRRWLAIMPGGDHFHIIQPPGLTVMRITGGRYRATATHRVVWT